MRRSDAPWRHDKLGSVMRSGLADVRSASPSPEVWERISAAIEPPPQQGPVRRALHRLSRAAPGGGHGALGVSWLLLPGSAALAVLLMVVVMREVPTSQMVGTTNVYRGAIVQTSAAGPLMPSMFDSASDLGRARGGRAQADQPVVSSGDVAVRVEAPRRWSRFEFDHYHGADDHRGPTNWLAAPEIALVY